MSTKINNLGIEGSCSGKHTLMFYEFSEELLDVQKVDYFFLRRILNYMIRHLLCLILVRH